MSKRISLSSIGVGALWLAAGSLLAVEPIQVYQLLGGGLRDAGWQRETLSQNRLALLPDLTHYDVFSSPRLATTVLPFLNGQSDARSWAEQVSASKQ